MFHFPQHSLQQITGSYKKDWAIQVEVAAVKSCVKHYSCNSLEQGKEQTWWRTSEWEWNCQPKVPELWAPGQPALRFIHRVWLPGQAKPSWDPRQLLLWSKRCTNENRLITQQKSGLDSREERLGTLSCKKTASPAGADLPQAHS